MKNTGRKKAALALAVSLWMAEGAFWAPGVASAEVTIESKADAEAKATAGTLGKKAASLLPYNSYFLNTGTKMNIVGGDCKAANFFAGYSDSEAGTAEANVSGYTLTVDSGTFDATTELAGGYSFNGTANNNSVYINGGEGGASVCGSRGQVGASGNTVAITGGTVGFVHGAYTYDGDATGNTVTIKGGTVDRVFGGDSHAGSATGNSVTVSGGTIGTGDEGDGVYGGRVFGAGSSAGAAEKNTVTVSGGTIYGSVYGGSVYSESNPVAAATGNIVKITETDTAAPTTIKKEVYGGYSQYDAANKNVVTISGGAIGTGDTNNVYGGYGYTDASENKVTISGGTMSGQVYGGYTGATGAANKNIVEISGGTVNSSVTGGYVDSFDAAATAAGNRVMISGGTVKGDVNGGVAGSATGNTVTITGGTVNGNIIGGWSKQGSASDNIITISGDAKLAETVMIYGGLSTNGGSATGNTVNILTAISVAHIMGGDGATSKDNTLNIAAKGVKVGAEGVAGFQNLNFYLPADMTKSDTMLTVSGLADVTDAKVGVMAQGKLTNLTQDDRVTLLHAETMNGTVSQTTEIDVPESIATVNTYEFNVTSDANNIYATITKSPDGGGGKDAEARENTKSVAETKAATTTFVNAGADMLASQGFAQAANAVAIEAAESAKNGGEGAAAAGGFTPFAAFGGSGMRAESGSYVDTRGFGLNVGFARELSNRQGKLLFGPVVEYGGGSYDSYLDNGVHGEGGSHYFGVGIMARQTNRSGFYYEGSVRGGRVTSDYKSYFNHQNVDYDSASNYWAAHVGVGKAFSLGGGNTLDGYVKYFYSHQAGDDVTMHGSVTGDEDWSFGSVDSHRVRIGARLTHKVNERNSLYGGLAYQYEFGGEATAHYNGGSTPSPSVKGSSGMLELGWQVKPGAGPLTLDLGVTGWAGKQRGGSVQLGATWSF